MEVEERKDREWLADLQQRLEQDPTTVTDKEILRGILTKFSLDSSGDFLQDADWLIEALGFTKAPVPRIPEEILKAWDRYCEELGSSLGYHDDPILEAIADWYDEKSCDEPDMAVRALAVYEHLFSAWQDRNADTEATDYVWPLIRLWREQKNFSRARFLAEFLEEKLRQENADLEDLLRIRGVRARLAAEERGGEVSRGELDLAKISDMALATISDRDRKIETITEESLRLSRELAQLRDASYPEPARLELKDKFGPLWARLDPETQKDLEHGVTFTRSPCREERPGTAPTGFFQAVKRELMVRVFDPYRNVKPETSAWFDRTTPVHLLIEFSEHRSRLEPDQRKSIKEALYQAGCRKGFLSQDVVGRLEALVAHRNQAQHPEKYGPYSLDALEAFLKEVWSSHFLVNFLKSLHP